MIRVRFSSIGMLVLLGCGLARPALAYNGNIPRMMWDCEKALAEQNYSRAKKLVSLALLHLKDEGFTWTERYLENLTEDRDGATPEEAAYIDAETAYVKLRLEWLTELRSENEWWKEQLELPDAGVLGPAAAQIRRKLGALSACVSPEIEATSVELETGDFDKAHELRGQALGLWKAELAEIASRVDRLTRTLDTATPEERTAAEACIAYLTRWQEEATHHTDALEKECQAETDPAMLLGRMRYYAAREEFTRPLKGATSSKVHLSELYQRKAEWAIAKGAPRPPESTTLEPPAWFCSTVLQPLWWAFPRELPE